MEEDFGDFASIFGAINIVVGLLVIRKNRR